MPRQKRYTPVKERRDQDNMAAQNVGTSDQLAGMAAPAKRVKRPEQKAKRVPTRTKRKKGVKAPPKRVAKPSPKRKAAGMSAPAARVGRGGSGRK